MIICAKSGWIKHSESILTENSTLTLLRNLFEEMYHKLKDIKDELAFLEFGITVKWYIIAEKSGAIAMKFLRFIIN